MQFLPVLAQVLIFILLIFGYYKLCTHREIGIIGKLIEIVALYSVSFWAILGHLKFSIWALLIGVIGLIKLSTTKKAKIERRIEGNSNNI